MSNIYVIKEVIEYVNSTFEETKQQHNSVNDVILKSALVYQYLYLRNFGTCISIDDVLELNNNEIGLIGPGNGCLTWFLEKNVRWFRHIAFTQHSTRCFWSIRVHICHTREPNTQMCKKISIVRSDFWINILCI